MEHPSSDTYQRLATAAELDAAATRLVQAARRHLVWFTRDLDPIALDNDNFAHAVRTLATRSRFSRIRIVAIDPVPAIRRGHRLIALAQRFSSSIEVRRAGRDHAEMAETFIIADETGILYRPLASRYEGYADTHAPLEARLHLKTFIQIWDAAEPDPEFRRLGI